MSRRAKRSRGAKTGVDRTQRGWVAWLCVLLGSVLGALGGWVIGPQIQAPQALEAHDYVVVSAALDETLSNPLLGRGSFVAHGTLEIRPHVFHSADFVSPVLAGEAGRVVLRLAEDSGTAQLILQDGSGSVHSVDVAPGLWHGGSDAAGQPLPPLTWELAQDAQGVSAKGGVREQRLNLQAINRLELTATNGTVRVDALQIWDAAGKPLLDDDFERAGGAAQGPLLGAVIGLLLGLAAATAVLLGPGPLALAWLGLSLLVPLGVLLVPTEAWVTASERLYLSRTPYWRLQQAALALAFLPYLVTALNRSRLLSPHRRLPTQNRGLLLGAFGLGALALGGLGMRAGLAPASLMGLGLGVLMLAHGIWLSHRLGLSWGHALLLELPGLVGIAALGWARGLPLLLLGRWLVTGAQARSLIERAPRLGSTAVLGLMLAIPFTVEIALQGTYLNQAWDLQKLSQQSSDSDWRSPEAHWSSRCPETQGSGELVRIAFVGGSSTGGSYQFAGEPTAMFPAQALMALCGAPGHRPPFAVLNFGSGGRDSFTAAETIDLILARSEAQLVVVYLGVNDLLTRSSSESRRVRTQRLASLNAAGGGALAFLRASRLITGVGLLFRPPDGADQDTVPEVGLDEARDNYETMAQATLAAGSKLLLLTEMAIGPEARQLEDYGAVQAGVADAHEHVHWHDLSQDFGAAELPELLADRNHLGREGNKRLGQVIAGLALGEDLGLIPAPVAPPSPVPAAP